MSRTFLGSLFAVTSLVAADLSNSDKETFLKTAKVLQTKTLSQGITNTKRAVLDDGRLRHDAHIQTIDVSKTEFEGSRGGKELNFRDCYKFNVAAYELDKMLEINMTPPSVERKIAGSAAAVTWWVDDVQMMEADRKKKKIEPPNLEDWARQMHVVRVFDQLIFNTDRNLGNLLITKDWKLRMIDHSRAFRIQRMLNGKENLVRCDAKLLARLRQLNKEELVTALKPYLTGMEIDGILARRDLIIKHFEKLIAEKGEKTVLYDLL